MSFRFISTVWTQTFYAAHYKSSIDDFNLELRHMKRMVARKTSEHTMPDFDSRGR